MPENEFDNISETKLEDMLQQGYQLPMRNKILAELEKRNKKKDDKSEEFANKTLNTNKQLLHLTWFIAIITAILLLISFFDFPKITLLKNHKPDHATQQDEQNNTNKYNYK